MRKTCIAFLLAFCCAFRAWAGSTYTATRLDQSSGLSENTVCRIIQDRMGFVWLATWNGLNRYDGRNFVCYKAEPGIVCPLPSGRIDWIGENVEGDIWCIVADRPYLFRRKEQRFVDVFRGQKLPPVSYMAELGGGNACMVTRQGDFYKVHDRYPQRITGRVSRHRAALCLIRRHAVTRQYDYTCVGGRLVCRDRRTGRKMEGRLPHGVNQVYNLAPYDDRRILMSTDHGLYFYDSPTHFKALEGWETQIVKDICVDRQRNIWMSTYPGVTVLREQHHLAHPQKSSMAGNDEFVRALYHDNRAQTWIADKNDVVRIVRGGITRYLSASGTCQTSPCVFGSNVYCIFQDSRGIYWLGTKKDGVFKLTPEGNDRFAVKRFADEKSGLDCPSVYAITEDDRHQLWIATFGGGVCRLVKGGKAGERFLSFSHYPKACRRVRCLYAAGGVMLAGTMSGLVTFNPHERNPRFHVNTRSERLTSLPNNDVMEIVGDSHGHIWLATLGGGVGRIKGGNLLSDQLQFDNISTVDGLASDVCLTLQTDSHDNLWIVSEMALTKYVPSQRKAVNFSLKDFGGGFIFSEVCPLYAGGTMTFGTTQGALTISPAQFRKSANSPEVALVRIAVEGKEKPGDYNMGDTLVLARHERNLVIDFSTLDYNCNTTILYKYKVEGIDEAWQVSDNPSLSLMNLPPGIYTLKVMSTNGDGIWNSRVRTLTIVVKPKFSETVWAKILYSLLMALLGIAVIGIVRYIYELRAQIEDVQLAANAQLERFSQRLQELLGGKPSLDALHTTLPEETLSEQRLFADRLMEYMNANIENSSLQVADMAAHMGMSKTLFYSRMKETLGCTPLNFILDLRIKRARQMLSLPGNNVSTVAYACGFSDPHYFSRCFKKVVGCSPTEYVAKRNLQEDSEARE